MQKLNIVSVWTDLVRVGEMEALLSMRAACLHFFDAVSRGFIFVDSSSKAGCSRAVFQLRAFLMPMSGRFPK